MTKDLLDQGFEFMVASNEAVRSHMNDRPFGIEMTQLDVFRPRYSPWSETDLLRILNAANGLAFGPRGLPMPLWVMLDLALMPSALAFVTLSRSLLEAEIDVVTTSDETRTVLTRLIGIADELGYHGPLPVAGYCATPTANRERWTGWSLWSLLPGRNLGVVIKGLALALYGTRFLDGVTQYDNPSLRIHTKFGALRVRSATLDLHTAPNSFVYETDLLPERSPSEEPSFWLDAFDIDRQRDMQSRIGNGISQFFVLPPGIKLIDGRYRLPILEVSIQEEGSVHVEG